MHVETLVEWREWGPAPFEEARAAGRPVLLSLSAPWCTWCARMDREAFSEPGLAANINDSFVPVRVDADRQPRVRERYQMGGFPSTVFLTPSGTVISGATYMTVESLRGVVDAVRDRYHELGEEAGSVPRALQDPEPPHGSLDGVVEHMNGQVQVAYDEEFGGWGSAGKFPLPRTVEFALKRDRDRAVRTLEAVYTHLYDTYDGGFYRYAAERDWSDPHREKLTDENAALVRAFANAYLYTGEETFRDPAEGTVDYLTTDLWVDDPGGASGDDAAGSIADATATADATASSTADATATAGAFAGSQAGDDAYFTSEPGEREAAEPPHVDRTVFADRNGLAVDALLRFHACTDHEGARRYAERALEHVLEELVADDGAVAHYVGGPRGLLIDQARVLAGLTTAAQVLDRSYVEPARTVADWTVERREDDGTFLDGLGGRTADGERPDASTAGLLDRPLRPIDATTELADALCDLAVLTGEDRYRDVAEAALSAFGGARDRMGVEVAGYATAVARVTDPDGPLAIAVSDEPGSDLHRAALRVADHEKVVRLEPPDGDGTATVVGRDGEASTPADLMSLVAAD